MTEAMNTNTIKGKILVVAVAMAGLFAILAIAAGPAKADSHSTVYLGNCSITAVKPEKSPISPDARGKARVYCAKETWVKVRVELWAFDFGGNEKLPGTRQFDYVKLGAGKSLNMGSYFTNCNEDPGTINRGDEVFSKVYLQIPSNTVGKAAESGLLNTLC